MQWVRALSQYRRSAFLRENPEIDSTSLSQFEANLDNYEKHEARSYVYFKKRTLLGIAELEAKSIQKLGYVAIEIAELRTAINHILSHLSPMQHMQRLLAVYGVTVARDSLIADIRNIEDFAPEVLGEIMMNYQLVLNTDKEFRDIWLLPDGSGHTAIVELDGEIQEIIAYESHALIIKAAQEQLIKSVANISDKFKGILYLPVRPQHAIQPCASFVPAAIGALLFLGLAVGVSTTIPFGYTGSTALAVGMILLFFACLFTAAAKYKTSTKEAKAQRSSIEAFVRACREELIQYYIPCQANQSVKVPVALHVVSPSSEYETVSVFREASSTSTDSSTELTTV